MISIKQLLDKKGHQVWTIDRDATVFECMQTMANKNVGALIVTHNDVMVGVISERDYARKVILKDRSSKDTLVSEIMTSEVFSVTLNMRADECLVLMNAKRIRHVPALENGKPVGMISVGDVVKEIIEEQRYAIHMLEENLAWAESY